MNETAGGNPSSSSPPPIHLPSLSSSGCFSSPRNVSTSSNSSSASSSPCPPPFSASSPAPPYVGHNRGRGRGGWRGGGYGGGGRTRGFYSSYRGGGGGRRGGGGGYNGSSSYHYSQDSIRSFHNGPTSPTFKRRQEGEMIIPAAKICAVCGSEDIKYKLPCCRKPFCSSLCFKKHQEESPCKGSRQGGGEGSRGRETGAPSREREQENRGGEQGDQDRRRESDPSVSSSSASYGSSVCGVDTESERRDGRELGKKDERESEASDVICVGEGVHTPDNKKDSNKQDHDVEVKGKGEGEESPRSEKKKERNSKRRREEEHISVFGSLLHDVEDEGPIGEVEELVVCHEENEVDLPPGKMPSKLASKSLRQGRRRDLDGEEEEDDEEEGEEGELSDSAEEDEHDPHDTRVFQDIEDEEEEEDLSSDGEGEEEEEEDDRQPPRSLPASIIPGVDDEGDADHELSIQQKDALRCSSYLREAFEKSRNLRDAFQDIATSRDKTATLACYLNDGWFEGICNRVMDIVMMKEKEEE